MRGLAWNVIATLIALYVVQLLLENWAHLPLGELMAWWPLHGENFHPWQPLTFAFFQSPDPISAVLTWVVLYLFLPTLERLFGRTSIAYAAGASLMGAVLLGAVLDGIGALTAPGYAGGIGPVLTGFFLLFGLAQPNAKILLFFVIPVQAGLVAWVTGLLAFLYLLAYRSLDGATWFGGWLGAYAWFQLRQPGGWRRPYLKWKHARLQKKLRRFEVLPGGRDDNVH